MPLLPFITEEENKLYATCILDPTFPKNDEDAAIKWCEYVDGYKIFPKLAVHIRNHREKFERGQRIRCAEAIAGPGNAMLRHLNHHSWRNGCWKYSCHSTSCKSRQKKWPKDKKKRAGQTCKKCRQNGCLANDCTVKAKVLEEYVNFMFRYLKTQ